jgi:acyl carrier protein
MSDNAQAIVPYVIEAVYTVLQDTSVVIHETTPLEDLKGFDSLAIVSILERLEDQLAIEMDPELILPETFENPRTLADAFMKSRRKSEAMQ